MTVLLTTAPFERMLVLLPMAARIPEQPQAIPDNTSA